MPTVLDPNQAAPTTDIDVQPKVMLAPDVQQTITPPIQPVGGYSSEANIVDSTPTQTPMPPVMTAGIPVASAVPPTNSTDQSTSFILENLNSTETELTDQLQSASSEQTNMLDKMKQLVEQTGLMESKEVKLNKHIQAIQKLRASIQAQPSQTASLIMEAELPEDVKAKLQTELTSSSTTASPTLTPTPSIASASGPQPIPPATPTTPPIGTSTTPVIALTPDQIITRLQAQFGQTNPTIQSTVVSGAQVYTTPDSGVLVEFGGQAVQFSSEDLTAAQVPFEALRELPQKITTAPAQTVSEPVVQSPVAEPGAQVTVAPETVVAENLAASPAEQKIILKLRDAHLAEVDPLLTETARVYLSPDNNGIIVVNGQLSQHVPDSQLIQMGATAEDLLGLMRSPAAPMPTIESIPTTPPGV